MKRTRKGWTVVASILAVAVGLVLGFSGMSSAADQVVKLKFQGKWSGHEKQNWAAEQLKFADRVKAATGGKVEIVNVVNEVTRDAEVLDGVRRGLIDIGAQPVHIRGELALVNFCSIPAVSMDSMPTLYGLLKPTFEGFWDKQGAKQMGYIYFLPQGLFTKKPCTTAEDLKGLKVRIQGNILVQLYKAAGASPMTMNNAEVYQAGQRGIIDGAQSALAAYFSNAWYEVFKYYADWPLGGSAMAVVMNKNSWGKLTPELQKQVMAAWNETENAQYHGILKDVGIIEKQLTEKGAVRQNPSKAEAAKLNALVAPIVNDWKAKLGADGDKVVKTMNGVLGTKF